MSDFPTRFDAPEDAYRGFFRADSAKNAEAWAAVMSYPHVRVSATGRTSYYYETPAAYAAAADWTAREATGWVRSEGVEPVRLHESPDKVHLLGGWTRFNAAGESILRNRVTYVLTRVDGSWGIQARFGVDSFGEAGDEAGAAGVDCVRETVEAWLAGEHGGTAERCRFPFIAVGVGEVRRIAHADGLATLLPRQVGGKARLRDVRAVQAGPEGAVVAFAVDGVASGSLDAVAVVGQAQGLWTIGGLSLVVADAA